MTSILTPTPVGAGVWHFLLLDLLAEPHTLFEKKTPWKQEEHFPWKVFACSNAAAVATEMQGRNTASASKAISHGVAVQRDAKT